MSEKPSPPYAPLAFKHAWKYLPEQRDPANLLHRVAIVHGPSPDWGDSLEMLTVDLIGTTCCGELAVLSMPGMFDRMGAPRCEVCCDAVGVPYGDGIPGNGDDICPADQWVSDDYTYANGPIAPLDDASLARIAADAAR